MGLDASPHGPWLFHSVINTPSSNECTSDLQSQINVFLYVNDFVFYSSDRSQEDLFKTLLQEHTQVDFMGNVDYFLGTDFTWIQNDYGNISVHL